MICHASGVITKPISQGYFLIVVQDKKSKDYHKPICGSDTFENEWMEVELKCDCISNQTKDYIPRFLQESAQISFLDGPIYKQMHLEIDPLQKSDRVEWGHLRYHRRMTPGYAYELVVQWLTASGSIVYDLIYGWCRKAPQCGLQLVPIPADLLAEPFTEKSDPLRGPIFIPLNLNCLERNGPCLFDEFDKETYNDRLILFQEAIVIRFGFVPAYVETITGSNETSFDRQYVHCTGSMFILVPTINQSLKIRRGVASGKKSKESPNLRSHSLNKIYPDSLADIVFMSRHVNTANSNEFENNRKVGFLWSWNHMVPNKKWKSLTLSSSPSGELLPFRILADFKEFCSNQNERLTKFWEECLEQKKCNEKIST